MNLKVCTEQILCQKEQYSGGIKNFVTVAYQPHHFQKANNMNEFNGSEQEYSDSFDWWGLAHLATTTAWGDGYVKNVSSPNCMGVRNTMNIRRWQRMHHISNHHSSTAIYASTLVPHLFNWKLNKLNVQLNHALLECICNPSGASCHYFWTNLCIYTNYITKVCLIVW